MKITKLQTDMENVITIDNNPLKASNNHFQSLIRREVNLYIFNTPSLIFLFDYIRCEFPNSFSFPSGLNELHCSLSIGGIPLLILATQETQCVGKSGEISPVNNLIQ
jgi:hypothetical protein